jgi:hypothetical protein
MPSPAEAVQALVDCREKISRLEAELVEAKQERKDLEERVLPPLFLQARVQSIELPSKARAVKSLFAYARLAKEGPKRAAMLDWLSKVGEQDAIKATLVGKWGRGEYEIAQKAYEQLRKDNTVDLTFSEQVEWKQLESIVLNHVKRGDVVPLDDIGATVGDHVTITRNPVIV